MNDLISRQAAIDALEKVADMFPWRVPGNRDTYDRYNEAWNDAIGRAEMEIENMPPAQPGWIPCGEKEPTESGNYLLYRPHFWGAYEGQTTVCYWNGEFWSDDYCSEAERSLPVIEGMFWMPLPEPWKGNTDAH